MAMGVVWPPDGGAPASGRSLNSQSFSRLWGRRFGAPNSGRIRSISRCDSASKTSLGRRLFTGLRQFGFHPIHVVAIHQLAAVFLVLIAENDTKQLAVGRSQPR